jgi:hypothetical protein
MAIEVRKLVIKTVIENKTTTPVSSPPHQQQDFEHLKAQLLKQCRQMIKDYLRREKER